MRKSSPAKSAASSPPVPARISTMQLRSSSGSCGRSSGLSSSSRRLTADCRRPTSARASAAISGSSTPTSSRTSASSSSYFLQKRRLLDHLHEPLVLAAQRCHQPGIAERLRVEQLPLDLRRAGERVGEEIPEAQTVAGWGLAYFWRKRSTRPAVSISFCLPVKNGWHGGADVEVDLGLRGAGLERIPARAADLGRGVHGMDFGLSLDSLV